MHAARVQARWAQSDIYDDTVMKPTCKARRIKFEAANLQTHTHLQNDHDEFTFMKNGD